jgi:CheY-like chemotaxis protein
MSEGRVLVVDDEADVRKSIRLILSKAGYDVVEAEDGEAGVRAVNRGDNSFALSAIICDLNMPKMSGMEAITYFRYHFPHASVIAGVITYDGHGHATVTDQGVVIGTGSPDKFDEACEYRYKVASDGSFSQKGSCTGVGGSYFLSGIKERGQMGVGGSVLITNLIGTDVETLVAPAPPAAPEFTQYRRCGGVGTAVRIQPH